MAPRIPGSPGAKGVICLERTEERLAIQAKLFKAHRDYLDAVEGLVSGSQLRARWIEVGGWSKFESTHSYLQTGLYAAIGIHLLPAIKDKAKELERRWPRGISLPMELRLRLLEAVDALFALGGKSWGLEGLHRATGTEVSPPPPRLQSRWARS